MTASQEAWPQRGEGPAARGGAYTCGFVPVPAAEMQDLARHGVLALLHRVGARTTIYCRGDHFGADLARAMSETATRYSRLTVRHDEPVSPRQALRFRRVHPDELPAGMPTVALFTDQTISYMAADQITEELALQLGVPARPALSEHQAQQARRARLTGPARRGDSIHAGQRLAVVAAALLG